MGFGAIIINVVGRATQASTTTAILENDTEKVILYKKNDARAQRCATTASNSQILNELNALTK